MRIGIIRVRAIKIAEHNNRRTVGVKDIKADVSVAPVEYVLDFSKSIFH